MFCSKIDKNVHWLFLTWSLLMFITVQGEHDENRKSIRASTESTSEFENVECECMPFYQCNNTYGEDIITLRMPVVCENLGEVCCDHTSEEQLNLHALTIDSRYNADCGIRNSGKIDFRISGTYESMANFGEFPWMVAIMMEEGRTNAIVYKCGGSLIHPKVVLTAAHCVNRKKIKQLRVRAGTVDLEIPHERYPYADRKIQKVIVHEKFHRGAAFNDIALLILDKPFVLSQYLDTICFPRFNATLENNCIVTGWGKSSLDGELHKNLKMVELPIVPREQCQAALKKTRLGKKFTLHESFICAGGVEGADSCKGDGGSPLICPVRDGVKMKYQQVGIVSWGINCGTEVPGVYVNVLLFVDWIDDQMNKILIPR